MLILSSQLPSIALLHVHKVTKDRKLMLQQLKHQAMMAKAVQELIRRREPLAVNVQVAENNLLSHQARCDARKSGTDAGVIEADKEKEERFKEIVVNCSKELEQIDNSITEEVARFNSRKQKAFKDTLASFVKHQVSHEKKLQGVWGQVMTMVEDTEDEIDGLLAEARS